MSIELTTLSFNIQDLTSSAKYLLTILCFRANQNNEVYSSINRLCIDTSSSINTVEKNLKILRDKKYLIYSGRIVPKTKNIPIYSININHPNFRGDKKSTTPINKFNHPKIDDLTPPKFGVQKDHNIKDNKKDYDFSLVPTQDQKNEVYSDLKAGYKIREDMQWIYAWLIENELKNE